MNAVLFRRAFLRPRKVHVLSRKCSSLTNEEGRTRRLSRNSVFHKQAVFIHVLFFEVTISQVLYKKKEENAIRIKEWSDGLCAGFRGLHVLKNCYTDDNNSETGSGSWTVHHCVLGLL
jgi:hypothetical protein